MINKLKYLSNISEEKSSEKFVMKIPNDIRQIHKMFKKNHKQLFVVGGAVRDAILGKTPKDYDLATDAKPDEVLQMAKDEGLKTLELGKSFGIVVINGYEIATFRKDIGKGRRPDAVDFTDIKTDVLRRDLTINALFYDLDRNEIVDLVGGIKDLHNKHIRTVGKAEERFDEDPLRKLRALRFLGQLGGSIHNDTYKALEKNPSLKGVSAERIRDEFVKGLKKAKSTKQYLTVAAELKMLPEILPGLQIKKPFIEENDYQILIADLLQNNELSAIYNKLYTLKYENSKSKEINNIVFLISLKQFEPSKVFKFKKAQDNTKLTDAQILKWGKLVGKDLKKFVDFKLSVKGEEVPTNLKGKEIGDWISNKEAQNYLRENIMKKSELKKLIKEELLKENSGLKIEVATAADIIRAINKTQTKPSALELEFRHAAGRVFTEAVITEADGKLIFTLRN